MDTNASPERLYQTRVSARELTPGRSLARRFPFLLLGSLFAATLFSAELASQSGGVVSGTVTAANKMPVVEARVRLVGTDLATVTRVDGAFQVAQVPAGRQTLEVRMVGYTPMLMPVDIAAGATLHVSLVLEPLVLEAAEVTADANFSPGMVQLPAVRVTAKPSLPPELVGFQERRARGAGSFFTREEIARMQPVLFTDVLRRVPGMQLQPVTGPFGTGYTVGMGRNGGVVGARACPMLFYVNGVPFPVNHDVPINHFIVPEEIAAIEVYTGMSRVPPQFTSSMHNARCGVVVVWTYSGERRHGSSRR